VVSFSDETWTQGQAGFSCACALSKNVDIGVQHANYEKQKARFLFFVLRIWKYTLSDVEQEATA
jgi:hypothetical protein